MSENAQAVHDVGGREGGALNRTEPPETQFQKRVDALLMLMVGPKVGAFKVDALRRMVESNSPQDYANLGYYEKWIRAIRDLLLEQEMITADELDEKLADVRRRMEAGHG